MAVPCVDGIQSGRLVTGRCDGPSISCTVLLGLWWLQPKEPACRARSSLHMPCTRACVACSSHRPRRVEANEPLVPARTRRRLSSPSPSSARAGDHVGRGHRGPWPWPAKVAVETSHVPGKRKRAEVVRAGCGRAASADQLAAGVGRRAAREQVHKILVALERMDASVRHSGRRDQRRAHPSRKGASRLRHHRQTAPQHVGGRRCGGSAAEDVSGAGGAGAGAQGRTPERTVVCVGARGGGGGAL